MLPLYASSGAAGLAIGLAYAAAGVGTALALHRRGQPNSSALSALLCWLLMLPALSDAPPPRPAGLGPLAERIDAGCDALLEALAQPVVGEMAGATDVERLRGDLHRADGRVELVDRLLRDERLPSDPDAALAESLDTLRRARSHAVGEVEAVLSGVHQLRVQVGLLALAGDSEGVGERLQALSLRVGALEELASIVAPGGGMVRAAPEERQ